MIWSEAIEHARQTLAAAGVEDVKINIEYLAAHVLRLQHRSEVRSVLDREIAPEDLREFGALIHRRAGREPLQYILGEWEFFGLPIQVGPEVLIPRPETEILVEEALREAALFSGPLSILDIGTGSGAIALVLASKLPKAVIVGVDSSAQAIALAEVNKSLLHIRNVEFTLTDTMWMNRTAWHASGGRFDLIVSNPPYISLEEFQKLEPELRLFEPRQALTDESTGLTFYDRITDLAPEIMSFDGRLLVELGYGVSEAVSEIMRDHRMEVLRVSKDLAGIPRVLVARLVKD